MEDEFDFDELLADAEQEHSYDDDMMDDMEAELAMEAEASTRTPLSGSTSLRSGVGITSFGPGAADGDDPAPADDSNRNQCPSPLPLERRLGVSPREEEGSPSPLFGGGGDGHTSGAARRALNNDGRSSSNNNSPLHPVLRADSSSSRWSGNRTAHEGVRVAQVVSQPHRRDCRSFHPGGRVSCSQDVGSGKRKPLSGAGSRVSRSSRTVESAAAAAKAAVEAAATAERGGVLLNRPVVDGNSVPFMQSGGRMMHLKVRAAPTHTVNCSMGRTAGSAELTAPPSGGLLRIPMETLMERVTERRVVQRSIQTAAVERAAAAKMEKGEDEADVEDKKVANSDVAASAGGKDGDRGDRARCGDGALWVDKYAPEGFRDLLSDEKINREVLRAVKAWDPFVFKKEATKASSDKKNGMGGGGGGMKKPPLKASPPTDSADKRPEARIIMLCGPPGLGKTTLAQVVARHAGYRVYEINASDDRTATVLRQRITEAMEGNTLLADKRPNLIVLDEVDGADGKAAAQVLVDIAAAPLTKRGDGKKGKRRTPLTRPLVLICNDQWTPALRPIRGIAQVFVFKVNSSPIRLVQRLKAICASERLTINTDALTRLADRSHLDVRSCLNTLQFVARRAASGGVRNASAALLTVLAEGVKDERRDLFEVLRSVFTRQKSSAKRRLFLGAEQGSMADRNNPDVYEEVLAFNDHGKVLAGVHENFLGVRFNDPTLCKAAAAMDWLETADLMEARTSLTQDYSFSRYAPLAAAGVHFLCRSDQRATVKQPKKDYEARTARSAKANILHSFADGRQLGVTGRTPQALVLDVLSHLMDIVAPPLRPLNPDLLSSQERARFRSLVGVLLSCGLTFSPQSASSQPSAALTPYGAMSETPAYALEPAIDQLLMYESYDFAHARLAPPLRPMVAHEVSLEAMRQAESSRLSNQGDPAAATAAGNNTTAAGPFTTAASDAPRKAEVGNLVSAEASSSAPNHPESEDTNARTVDSGIESNQAGSEVAAAATAQRRGLGTASGVPGTEQTTKGHKTTVDERLIENEKKRPAHPVPFWNRTNWIPGRKDGTGSRNSGGGGGGGGAGGGGNEAGPSKDNDAGADFFGRRRKSKRASGEDSEETRNAAGAIESSKRARQEGVVAAAATPRSDGPVDGGVVKVPIRYQFRAGYTNAVRRPVRMRDLL